MFELSAVETVEQIRQKAWSAKEAVQTSLSAIESLNGQVGSFLSVDGDRAIALAEEIDPQVQLTNVRFFLEQKD